MYGSTSTTSRTGRCGWTSPSCSGRSRPFSRAAARTSAIPLVSVIVVTYNVGPALTRCLESLAGVSDFEAILVNNGEDGPEIAAAAERDFVTKVLRPGRNLGFSAGCNAGAREATGDVLLFLNPDTVVAPGAIAALARTLEDLSVAIAMPRIRLLNEPDLLNSGGNVLHVSGLAWAGMFREPAEDVREIRDIPYASGTALAIRARLFWELGGFTEELFLYQEDLELSWRAHMRGLRVVVTPEADVYHEYDFARHSVKTYFLERNRMIFLSTHFSCRLLALGLPVILGAEVALTLLAAKEGWLNEKARAWAWCALNVPWLLRHRRETQGLRRVSDRELAGFLRATIDPGMRSVPRIVRAANPLVDRYWSLARRAL